VVLIEEKKYAEALRRFDEALRLNPTHKVRNWSSTLYVGVLYLYTKIGIQYKFTHFKNTLK